MSLIVWRHFSIRFLLIKSICVHCSAPSLLLFAFFLFFITLTASRFHLLLVYSTCTVTSRYNGPNSIEYPPIRKIIHIDNNKNQSITNENCYSPDIRYCGTSLYMFLLYLIGNTYLLLFLLLFLFFLFLSVLPFLLRIRLLFHLFRCVASL